jgi:hypothetical protein
MSKIDPRESKFMQVGGDHYLNGIEPRLYANSHNMNYEQCCILRYITRYKDKNGIEDLKKARHLINILIEDLEDSN